MTMLQFSGVFISLSVRQTTRVPLWCATQQLVTAYSTISNPKPEPTPKDSDSKQSTTKQTNSSKKILDPKKDSNVSRINMKQFFKKEKPKDVEKLLSSVDSTMTPEFCLRIISSLSALVKQGKTTITDFESDPRYKNLCQILLLNSSKKSEDTAQNISQEFRLKHLGFLFDMNKVQELTESPNLSIYEAVKVMSKLAFYKSRQLPVLETLSERIVNSDQEITIKTASDILYNMAVLNFYNESLINKIVLTLNSKIPSTKAHNCAVIGSILKSIGLLRYRNESLLSQLTTWILKNHKSSRPQDICSFLVTLAVLGYIPKDLEKFEVFTSSLQKTDLSEESEWLDVVWALVILNQAQESQVMSVLESEFLKKLTAMSKVSESKKRKILNISAAAKLIFKKDADHLFIESPSILEVTLEKNKDQQDLVKAIVTSLHAFLPTMGCLSFDLNTGMGFALDATFYVDKNCNPVLCSQLDSKGKGTLKIAVQSLSYYDYCRGDENVIGPVSFQLRMLRLLDYYTIPVSYKELQSNRKVVDRVKYLKERIQETVKQSSV